MRACRNRKFPFYSEHKISPLFSTVITFIQNSFHLPNNSFSHSIHCHTLFACEEFLFCDASLLLLLLCLLLLCYRKFHRLHSVCCAAVYSTAPTTTKTKQWRPLYSTSGPNHKNRTQNLFENSFFLFMIQKFSTFLSVNYSISLHSTHFSLFCIYTDFFS